MRTVNVALVMGLLLPLADTAHAATGTAVLANNNPAGSYADGIFRLPQLADARDNYVLMLTVDGKQKPAIELRQALPDWSSVAMPFPPAIGRGRSHCGALSCRRWR